MFTRTWQESIGNETIAAEVNAPSEDIKPSVLLLHGAGESHRGRADYLVDMLVRNGKACLRFDFSGHGESSGELAQASLARRLTEARAMSQFLDTTQPIIVIGTSMGGHVAAQLSAYMAIDHLVLCCPAAYDTAAQDVPFGADFRAIINQAGSTSRSDIWDTLRAFTGKATQIIGTQDEVIPASVTDAYDFALMHTDYIRIDLQDAPHALFKWLPEHPQWLMDIEQAILR